MQPRMRRGFYQRHLPRLRLGLLALAGVCALLGPTSAAQADTAFQKVLKSYTKGQATLKPCQFSAALLQSARGQIPADIEQYAPDFRSALDAALAAHARGECSGGGSTRPGGAGPLGSGGSPPSTPGSGGSLNGGGIPGSGGSPGGSGTADTPAPPTGPVLRAGADSGLPAIPLHPVKATSAPAPVVLLGLLGLLVAVLALSRLLIGGTSPFRRLRHAFSEAGFRAGTAGDWLRLGR